MKKFPVTIIKKHGIVILLQAEITEEFKREINSLNDEFIESISYPKVYPSLIRINGSDNDLNYFHFKCRVSEKQYDELKTNLERVKKELGYD